MSYVSLSVRACVAWLRVQRAARLGTAEIFGVAGAFWSELLSDEEKHLVTLLAHDAPPEREKRETLSPSERGWFSRRLPEPPARVLVGGAGAGREARALVAMGYHVDAFEPSMELVRELRERMPAESVVLRGSFRNLVRSLREGAGAFAPIVSHRYDAFVFASGSLSHILQRDERERVLEAACELAQGGPVLMSYWRGAALPEGDDVPRRLARKLGRSLRRGVFSEEDHRGEVLRAGRGFAAPIHDDEIEAIAAHVLDRDVLWEDREGYPRATLTSRTTSSR